MMDNYELINQVDEFYNSAWNKLLLVGTVSFAIVGILVPYILQWYQKKSIKLSENELRQEIAKELEEIKVSLMADVISFFNEQSKKYEEKFIMQSHSSEAGLFHIQGRLELSNSEHKASLFSFLVAAKNYNLTQDYINLRAILETIDSEVLQGIKKSDIEELQEEGWDIIELLDLIKENASNGAFFAIVRSLKSKLKDMK